MGDVKREKFLDKTSELKWKVAYYTEMLKNKKSPEEAKEIADKFAQK